MEKLASFSNSWFEFVHEQRFDSELEGLIGEMPRADEFLRGVQMALCANPFAGKPTDSDSLVLVLFSNLLGFGGVGIYYSVRGERIILLSIRDINGEAE